jgi:hypothetical protein
MRVGLPESGAQQGHVIFESNEGDVELYVEWDVNNKIVRESCVRINEEQRQARTAAMWGVAAKRIVAGAVGWVKASFGIDAAEQQVIDARLEICDQCEHSLPKDKEVINRKCGKLMDVLKPDSPTCGCWLKQKVVGAQTSCPILHW